MTKQLPPIRKTKETLALAFQRVLELQEEGKLDRADRLCRAVLATQPNYREALHWFKAYQYERKAFAEPTKRVRDA